MKRRKGYRRKQGHRQGFTEVRVLDIDFGTGKSAPAPKAKAAKPAAKAAPTKAAKPKAAKKVEAVEVQPVVESNITDSARELADEAGLDLSTIEGTGKEGRILKSDVQKAIKKRDEA